MKVHYNYWLYKQHRVGNIIGLILYPEIFTNKEWCDTSYRTTGVVVIVSLLVNRDTVHAGVMTKGT